MLPNLQPGIGLPLTFVNEGYIPCLLKDILYIIRHDSYFQA